MKIAGHAKQAEVEKDLQKCYEKRPALAYVDSRKGITNLHVARFKRRGASWKLVEVEHRSCYRC